MPQSRRRTTKKVKRPSRSTAVAENKSNQTTKLVVSVGVAVLALGVLVYMVFILYQSRSQPSAPSNTASGLKIVDEVVGTGPSPKPGQRVTVHYTGKFEDGTKFESSRDSGQPYEFIIGQGAVIQGWRLPDCSGHRWCFLLPGTG